VVVDSAPLARRVEREVGEVAATAVAATAVAANRAAVATSANGFLAFSSLKKGPVVN
jgi:hypothetical protein